MNKPVSELTGAELDLWTARAAKVQHYCRVTNGTLARVYRAGGDAGSYAPSTDWLDAGPLLTAYGIKLDWYGEWPEAQWLAKRWEGNEVQYPRHPDYEQAGDTPMQAICRVVVQSAFGLTVAASDDAKNF